MIIKYNHWEIIEKHWSLVSIDDIAVYTQIKITNRQNRIIISFLFRASIFDIFMQQFLINFEKSIINLYTRSDPRLK